MIAYLAPALIVVLLVLAAVRLRQQIEPACPACESRRWNGASSALACSACGWSMGTDAAEPERLAA